MRESRPMGEKGMLSSCPGDAAPAKRTDGVVRVRPVDTLAEGLGVVGAGEFGSDMRA